MSHMGKRIAVLVSGGVDSGVALALLKEQGHDVTAFYLKIWLEDELAYLGDCPWQEDLNFVQAVCEKLQVPLEVVNLQKEYFEHVVSYAINEVKVGRTPNPDIFCNVFIKFGLFIAHIDKTYPGAFDKIASGHYAQLLEQEGMYCLKKAPDPIKDQTYFLSLLKQEQLKRLIFPIGHLKKAEVRLLAERFDLANKHRKDSQGICFLGKLKFNDFLKHYLGERSGDKIEYETGIKLGEHRGFWYHTVGQRQGSGLSGGPWYVVTKDAMRNIVYFSKDYHAHDHTRKELTVTDLNFFVSNALAMNDLGVKLRHGPHLHACTVQDQGDGRWRVSLATADQGIAPGQIAAFYKDDLCIGAGIIAELSTI